jgi:hypothetical protein
LASILILVAVSVVNQRHPKRREDVIDAFGEETLNGTLIRREELIKEWATYYPANLRPTLLPRGYQTERELLLPLQVNDFGAYWDGEYGSEKLT